MHARRRLLLAAAALAATGPSVAQPREESLDGIGDLRPLLADVRRLRAPLLVLFSTPGCPYCREVRGSYLAPRIAEQSGAAPNLLIREVDITSRAPLVDGQGRRTTHSEFAARLGVRVVPVVAFFDEGGQVIGSPLVGIDRSGFYEAYLARAIDEARRRLRP